MQPIAEWLAKIGLERYAAAFAENDIDVTVLPHLTDADLEKIGVSLGHKEFLHGLRKLHRVPKPVRPPHIGGRAKIRGTVRAQRGILPRG